MIIQIRNKMCTNDTINHNLLLQRENYLMALSYEDLLLLNTDEWQTFVEKIHGYHLLLWIDDGINLIFQNKRTL